MKEKDNIKIIVSKSALSMLKFDIQSMDDVHVYDAVDKNRDLLEDEFNHEIYVLYFVTFGEYCKIKNLYFKKNKIDWLAVILDQTISYKLINDEDVHLILDCKTNPLTQDEFEFLVKKSFHYFKLQNESYKNEEILIKLMDMKRDQEDLISIGKALSLEKDPDTLLRKILFLSKKITGADAGSIYLVEENEDGEKQLRFKYSHTFSKEIPIEEFVMPLNEKSIAGYVALTGQVLNLKDVYNLPENAPFSFNKSIDLRHQYRSKTMLVVPMRNHVDQIIGVIQLLNSKEDIHGTNKITGNEAFEIRLNTIEDFETKVVPFDPRYESLMEAVASQAAIAIENNRMIRQIETQFEEFVKASVHAIESRDRATSGHSFRVAELCKHMAIAINNENNGVFKEIKFSDMEIKELEYAALLHDFGKVYIDLAVFMKGKKLYPKDFENVMLKINYLYRFVELQALLQNYSQAKNFIESEGISPKMNIDVNEKLKSIKKIKELICQLNEPTVTELNPEKTIHDILQEINDVLCKDIDGNEMQVIDETVKKNLLIRKGSLNDEERKEIESHVIHTYNFVSKIPWPPEYKNIPEIALKHHEKMDGSGYPYGLKGDEIPIQARMMAIADIYDALTASDRPYKKAISKETALNILKEEAEAGKIDKNIYEIFIKYKIYDAVDRDFYRISS